MMQTGYKRISAGLLLLILAFAHVGHTVHVFTEDPRNFAAFSGDLVPDNGAESSFEGRCLLCNVNFFPFLEEIQPEHQFYSEVLAVLQPEDVQCACCESVRYANLRAPPIA